MNNLGLGFPCTEFHPLSPKLFTVLPFTKVPRRKHVVCSNYRSRQASSSENAIVKKENVKQTGKREHHLWMKKDSAGSGQKALNLVRIVSEAPNEKEAVYGALDKWTAWEVEFPLIAAAKALRILQKRNQWLRVLQVFADMEELGVKPDEDTVRKVARAFNKLGDESRQKLVLKKYLNKWKYIHFNGERVRVRRQVFGEEISE